MSLHHVRNSVPVEDKIFRINTSGSGRKSGKSSGACGARPLQKVRHLHLWRSGLVRLQPDSVSYLLRARAQDLVDLFAVLEDGHRGGKGHVLGGPVHVVHLCHRKLDLRPLLHGGGRKCQVGGCCTDVAGLQASDRVTALPSGPPSMRTTVQQYLLGNPQKVRKNGLAVRAPRRPKVDNGLHMVARRERRMQVLDPRTCG